MFPVRLPEHRVITVALLIALLMLVACNASSRPEAQSVAEATASPPPLPTEPPVTPTITDTPTDVPTATNTATATSTYTSTPTSTPTFTVTPSPTATYTPSNTPVATNTRPPTNTPVPTNTPRPSNTPRPTATPTDDDSDPPSGDNLFQNPGFEEDTRPVIFGEVNVSADWEPFYCDEPYTPQKCPAERIGDGNPDGLEMGRPEYKPTDIDDRVHSGNRSQQWFCFFRTCRAGVFQTVRTTSGQRCVASAWVQSWSAGDVNGTDGQIYHSWTDNEDARDNSQWRILVDLDGGDYAWDDDVLESRVFGFDDGHYDEFAKISFSFRATGRRTTVFFENLRLWPFPHNDSYIDDAEVVCE